MVINGSDGVEVVVMEVMVMPMKCGGGAGGLVLSVGVLFIK